MARTTRFSAKIGTQLIRQRTAGATIDAAAEKVGIAPSTLYLWLGYGEAGIEPYVTFARLFRDAKAAANRAFVLEQVRLLKSA